MMIQALLRKIGLAPPAGPDAANDQTYSEAAMENAVRQSDKTIEQLGDISAMSHATNAKLRAGIERIRITSTDKGELMADLVRGMKSQGGKN